MFKGTLHIPVISFVWGGVLSYLSNTSLTFILLIVLIWLYMFRRNFIFMIFIISSFLFGYVHLSPPSLQSVSEDSLIPPSPVRIISTLKKTPMSVHMVVEDLNTKEKMNVTFFKKSSEDHVPVTWKHGAICQWEGEKERFQNARNPGEFNFKTYMNNRGVFYQLRLKNERSLECQGSSIFSHAYDFREKLMQQTQAHVDQAAFAWMAALIFGETEWLDEETLHWFREFNLSHLLAISGLHVGLMVSVIYLFIYRSGLGTKEQAMTVLLVIIPLFCFLAGAAPPVIRASIMVFGFILLKRLRLTISSIDLLSIIAFGLLFYSPTLFTHIGFQFSFIVTFSLLLSLPILKNQKNFWLQSALISAISQLSILPIQLHHFFQFNPASLIANLIMVPYFSFFYMPVLLFTFSLSLFVPSFTMVLSGYLNDLHEGVLEFWQSCSTYINIQWVVGELSTPYILGYFCLFCIMMRFWQLRHLNKAFFMGVYMVSILIAFSLKPYLSPYGTITMLDVGQGDAFVIELPFRKGVVMIDAAGPPAFISNADRTAEKVIIPYLKSRGIGRLHALILSHQDSDHSGSVPAIIRNIQTDQLVVGKFYPVIDQKIKVLRVGDGDRLSLGGQVFDVISPEMDYSDANDNSVVLYTEFGGLRWLFTGDISKQVEEHLMTAYPKMQVDVLKVAHHGSRTSTSERWVQKIHPVYAWISAGKNNRYGHPHPEVIGRLEQRDVLIYQTEKDGAVQYKFSESGGTFSRYLPYNASR
ncbi:DNA internalization-related competence protein ComEC/Rec2 [Halobacillus yeomjeoni]|nr:DNA internalization-related competence protein ComEC/Rec2 [Halobacillus yeomjeoni]